MDAAFRTHTTLGPGLLESVYDAVLAHNGFRADVNNRFRGQVNENFALPGIFIHMPESIS